MSEDQRRPINLKALALLFCLAAGLRVGFALTRPAQPTFADSLQYLKMARNFKAGKGPIISARQRAFRAPAYPIFLAAASTIQDNLRFFRICGAIVGACVPLLLVLLGRELGFCRASWIAGLGAAIYPHLIFFSALLLTETQFTALLLAALWVLARARNLDSWKLALAGGLLLGLATLTRFSLGLLPLFLLPLWWSRRRLYGLILLGFLLVILPWTIRNYAVLGGFVPFSTHLGHHVWEVLGPEATGGPVADHIRWPAGTHTLDELAQDRMLKRKTWQHVRSHPGATLWLAARKFLRYWSPIPNDPGHRKPVYILASLGSFGVVLIASMVAFWRRRHSALVLWPIWLPVAYYTLIQTTISMGSIRYRIPIEPYLILLAATLLSRPAASSD